MTGSGLDHYDVEPFKRPTPPFERRWMARFNLARRVLALLCVLALLSSGVAYSQETTAEDLHARINAGELSVEEARALFNAMPPLEWVQSRYAKGANEIDAEVFLGRLSVEEAAAKKEELATALQSRAFRSEVFGLFADSVPVDHGSTPHSGSEGLPVAIDFENAAKRYQAHVEWMAADERKGRQTGSEELFATADYIVEHFKTAGLVPGGDDGGWHQHFTVMGRRRLLDGNRLTLGGAALELNKDWSPFQSAVSLEVEAPLVFAGYGIQDEEGGWDDYDGLDVEGAVVVVLRKGPRNTTEDSPWAGEKRRHMSFAMKINAAYRAGAAALLVVNDPAETSPGSDDDTILIFAPVSGMGPSASLPAAHLTAGAAIPLLKEMGLDLVAAQAEMDETYAPVTGPIEDGKATVVIRSERPEIDTINVVGVLQTVEGDEGADEREYVVMGAHMDHVGMGLQGSSLGGDEARGQIHNGADDNASGTAGLIEAAYRLGGMAERPLRDIVFVAFSGEEWGLLGSRFFVEEPYRPLEQLAAMVNMDMIGRGVDGKASVSGLGSSTGFTELVEQTHADLRLGLDLDLGDTAGGNSDHAPFAEKGVPIIVMFTGLHEDYHRPGDDAHLIESESGAKIATLASELAWHVSRTAERPAFSAPPARQRGQLRQRSGGPREQGQRRGPGQRGGEAEEGDEDDPHGEEAPAGYQVVLGTVPDMAYQEEDGVRLAIVREGTPAEAAGLLEGDVVVALDGTEVRNLQDYAVLLFAHKPGETIKITARRGEDLLEVEAVLESRGSDG